jgi:hypothetical protein
MTELCLLMMKKLPTNIKNNNSSKKKTKKVKDNYKAKIRKTIKNKISKKSWNKQIKMNNLIKKLTDTKSLIYLTYCLLLVLMTIYIITVFA